MDPIGSAFAAPFGGYNIRRISKRPTSFPDFESVNTRSRTQQNISKNNWTTFCSAFAVASGHKILSDPKFKL